MVDIENEIAYTDSLSCAPGCLLRSVRLVARSESYVN